MSYIYLILAIVVEVAAVVFMKKSDALTRFWYALGGFVSYALSFALAGMASENLEVDFVYAVWSSVAILAIFIIGFLFFGEKLNKLKILSGLLIIFGVIGFSVAGALY